MLIFKGDMTKLPFSDNGVNKMAFWHININILRCHAADSDSVIQNHLKTFPWQFLLNSYSLQWSTTQFQEPWRVFWRPFCFGRFDTLILKIDDVMRQIRIQHYKIILEPLLDKFYSKMPWGVLLCFFFKFGPWLLVIQSTYVYYTGICHHQWRDQH